MKDSNHVEPFDYVVFGGTGDLARRKLFPALYYRHLMGHIPESARIISVSRQPLTNEEFIARTRDAIKEFVTADDIDAGGLDAFTERIQHVAVDAGSPSSDWKPLTKIFEGRDDITRVFYMATAPSLFGPIAENVGRHGLVTPRSRVVLEKPLGKNLETAREINDAVGTVFAEQAIYRIDHYLGKETVQNLMALRFANSLFEPLWSSNAIDHVQITVSETVGVEGRGGYYDHSGALRDMIQNHLLQLLCLIAMEPPSEFEANSVRDEKLKVLRALRPISGETVAQKTVRAQYRKGAVDGQPATGYLDEPDVAEGSQTETFCAIRADIDNWRWSGVPFYLRTGKRLPLRASEIVIAFKPVAHSIFQSGSGSLDPNRLIVRLQPDEGIKLELMTKRPGPGNLRLEPSTLNLSFAERFKTRNPDAYERLLMDVVRGDQTLFMRRDEVEAAWCWVESILDGWAASEKAPVGYSAGTWGPSESVVLITRDQRSWGDELL